MSNRKQERISTYAKDKVIFDFFPEVDIANGADENAQELSGREASLHAGALCLYATMLMTKVHESENVLDIFEPWCKERKASLKALAKASAKYVTKSDEEIDQIVDDMIKVDIRNTFAHGNFDISYDIYTGKLFFVLHSQRKDFVTSEPIVIDKNAIIKANKDLLGKMGVELRTQSIVSDYLISKAASENLSKTLKSFILPVQMQKLTDYYLDKKPTPKADVLVDDKIYYMVQYVLSSAKITYEQQDYYDIFGGDSNVFKAIALIRNTLAHDNLEFVDNAKSVTYADKHVSKTESIAESATKLIIADHIKELILSQKVAAEHSDAAIDSLKEELKKMFDFFFDGTYKFEDVANAFVEYQPGEKE